MVPSTAYVALLRGINVGGHNKLNMADLKACFERSGYEHVQTYINSGNVLFSAPLQESEALAVKVEKLLDENFSLPIRVVVRSAKEMQEVVESWPSTWKPEKSGYKYDIIFLSPVIDSPKIVENFNVVPEIEELHYQPGVLFWAVKLSAFRKSGIVKAKINQLPIYQEMTVRGPGSVRKISELLQG